MAKKIEWELIKDQYENTDRSVRDIADEYDVSHTSINNKVKAKGWEKIEPDHLIHKDVAKRKGVLGKVSIRKIEEIKEFLGNNTSPAMEPLIISFACDFEMWVEMKEQIHNNGGIIISTAKGKKISLEFTVLKELEKSMRETAQDLGLSTVSGKKLGLFELKPNEGDQGSMSDLNIKRKQLHVEV